MGSICKEPSWYKSKPFPRTKFAIAAIQIWNEEHDNIPLRFKTSQKE